MNRSLHFAPTLDRSLARTIKTTYFSYDMNLINNNNESIKIIRHYTSSLSLLWYFKIAILLTNVTTWMVNINSTLFNPVKWQYRPSCWCCLRRALIVEASTWRGKKHFQIQTQFHSIHLLQFFYFANQQQLRRIPHIILKESVSIFMRRQTISVSFHRRKILLQ